MSKGKYVIPVVMGQPGQEMYVIMGTALRDQKSSLARFVTRRAVMKGDEVGIAKATEKCRSDYTAPRYITELELVDYTHYRNGKITRSEAKVLEGFIRNTIPSSKSQAELDGWFLVDKNGDLMPLKLAKFSINLLDDTNKYRIIDALHGRA